MKLFKVRLILAIPGLILVAGGLWMIYRPAALIFAGACLCLLSTIQGPGETKE